jgi:hypothetical protein
MYFYVKKFNQIDVLNYDKKIAIYLTMLAKTNSFFLS